MTWAGLEYSICGDSNTTPDQQLNFECHERKLAFLKYPRSAVDWIQDLIFWVSQEIEEESCVWSAQVRQSNLDVATVAEHLSLLQEAIFSTTCSAGKYRKSAILVDSSLLGDLGGKLFCIILNDT